MKSVGSRECYKAKNLGDQRYSFLPNYGECIAKEERTVG